MQIIMRQVSGLGNQLFQYAAGRYYARRYGASMRMATDLARNAVSHGHPRPFLLSHFSIETPMRPLSTTERLLFSERLALKPVSGALKRLRHIHIFAESIEQRYSFLEDIPCPHDVRQLYLVGYWQTYRIAAAMETELRSDLTFRLPPTGKNAEMLARIASCPNPVSLHIRRGDYTLAVEGNIVLPIVYYTNAIQYFEQRLGDPTFFVFSDDIAFARTNLPAHLNAVFVDHNDDFSSHEDLRLMSACRHHIIANSSFSWWGAWLNPRTDKLVFAPKHWLLRSDSYYPDLYPPEWILEPSQRIHEAAEAGMLV